MLRYETSQLINLLENDRKLIAIASERKTEVISSQGIKEHIVFYLSDISHQLGLSVLRVEPMLLKKSEGVERWYAELTGSNERLLSLIGYFFSNKVPLNIHRFSLDQKHTLELELELTSSFTQFPKFEVSNELKIAGRLFCNDPGVFEESFGRELSRFSLAEMRLMGLMQYQKHKIALLSLPNNKVITVGIGAKVGVENAIVQSVTRKSITFIREDHSTYILSI